MSHIRPILNNRLMSIIWHSDQAKPAKVNGSQPSTEQVQMPQQAETSQMDVQTSLATFERRIAAQDEKVQKTLDTILQVQAQLNKKGSADPRPLRQMDEAADTSESDVHSDESESDDDNDEFEIQVIQSLIQLYVWSLDHY